VLVSVAVRQALSSGAMVVVHPKSRESCSSIRNRVTSRRGASQCRRLNELVSGYSTAGCTGKNTSIIGIMTEGKRKRRMWIRDLLFHERGPRERANGHKCGDEG